MANKDNVYREELMNFAVKIVQLKNYLNNVKHEYNMADQIQRSATSIGAMQREASYAESEADFIHKLGVAQKECGETLFWLELLHKTSYLSDEQFSDLYKECSIIMRRLSSSIKTVKQKLNNTK